jgi:hypothetical protein
MRTTGIAAIAAVALVLAACFTDAATRLAGDIRSGAGRTGRSEGAITIVKHDTPSSRGQCVGPYQVQVDKNGAIVVWCYDVDGNTVSSHSTSMHRPAVDTVETFIVQKDAGETLLIRLERRAGRVVITDVS